MAARLLIVLAAVVLIRLPFLDQAIQGDDVYYLAIARNALIDPLHPMQMGYTFQGEPVSMAGHPHPPLNAYVLAGLLRVFGEVREVPFHLFYVLFSLIAAASMYRLARRFTERPLLATLLFVSVPAFVVNGNSLEADLPFLAFWMAGFALYFDGRHRLAALSLALAGLAAYQAVFALPILAHHTWYNRRRSKTAWFAVLAAPAALAVWQAFQLLSSGAAPAGVLAGYLDTYGLLALTKKFYSAVALTGHLGWVVFPLVVFGAVCRTARIPAALGALGALLPGYFWWQRALLVVSLAAGLALLAHWAMTLWRQRSGEAGFLASWGLVFFGGAVAVFFAGSARYLLPLSAAVVLTIVRSSRRPWLLWSAAAVNLTLGLTLASANYQHWDGYRRFARDLGPLAGDRRIWSNAEWGLRHYLEKMGGEAIQRDQPIYAGSVLVTSELAGRIPFPGGGRLHEILRADLQTGRPARLFGLGTRSGYSSSDLGVLPFDLGRGRLDAVKADIIALPEPRAAYLRMGDPDSAEQLLSGFYHIEDKAWRWMGEQGVVLLKVPRDVSRFEMTFFIPHAAPARRVTLSIDGKSSYTETYPSAGRYTLVAPIERLAGNTVQATITVDRTFQPPRDRRLLGIIVQELGLR